MYDKLTGRVRHRIQTRLLGQPLLVLQVEELISASKFMDTNGDIPPYATDGVKRWRDADTTDMFVLKDFNHVDGEDHGN